MFARLALKELRETAWIAAAAMAVYVYLLTAATDTNPFKGPQSFHSEELPFKSDTTMGFVMAGMCLAAALGLRQTVGESIRGTYPFLLTRPANRWQLIGTKLWVGLGVYWAAAAVPLLLYGWWAATPGTHASPFRWSMTALAWQGWFAGSIAYLGGFLVGIRAARWLGTRLLPLVGAGGLAFFLAIIPLWWWAVLPAIALVDVLLVANVFFVARTRDFS